MILSFTIPQKKEEKKKKLEMIAAASVFSLSASFCAQSCVHKSDLRSTDTLSLVSTIPRIKRIRVRLFSIATTPRLFTLRFWDL